MKTAIFEYDILIQDCVLVNSLDFMNIQYDRVKNKIKIQSQKAGKFDVKLKLTELYGAEQTLDVEITVGEFNIPSPIEEP